MASAAESVGNRNLTLWNTVSENIRHKKGYGADDVVNDTAKVMAAAMDNVEDIWSSLMTAAGNSSWSQDQFPPHFCTSHGRTTPAAKLRAPGIARRARVGRRAAS